MPFSGETFKRLGLPPYAGALARELQNLADGLTTVNAKVGGGFTLDQGDIAPLDTDGDDGDWYLNTSDGSWYDKENGAWIIRYTDQLGAAGTTDGVVNALTFSIVGDTVTADLGRTAGLSDVTSSFVTPNNHVDSFLADVTGSDLSMTLGFKGSLPDLTQTVTLPSGGGISQADADARYLQLIGGTLASPGRLTIDVTGNNEALVINHHGGTSQSALHIFTNTSGSEKAFQASRSNQSTAFFSIEGSLGGGNSKPGIAFGGGGTARDTELYRDSANNWKTPDFFTAQGFSITGQPLTTWNALGIGNVLNGPPTLVGSVLTFTELDGTATAYHAAVWRYGRDGYLCHEYLNRDRYERPAKIHNSAPAQQRPANAHNQPHRAE